MRTLLLLGSLLSCVGCGSDARDLDALRDSIKQSRVTIGAMVTVAEASMPDGQVVSAELRPGKVSVYAYGTLSGATLHDVHVDTIEGHIVSSAALGSSSGACPASISISAAIAIAEASVTGGVAIAAIPDDDVDCAREIQVLTPDLLWEVKVAGDGQVLEVEESDETED